MSERVDLLIAGGGPVGAALAAALAGGEATTLLLEARPEPDAVSDPRAIALSHGSRLVLDRLGAWAMLKSATAIRHIHVSQQGGFGRTCLDAEELAVPALGTVVEYGDLYRAVHGAAAARGAPMTTGAKVSKLEPADSAVLVEYEQGGVVREVEAGLVVLADGGRMLDALPGITVATRDYGQSAVVARVRASRPHGETAWERFTSGGPVALLPQGDGYALVWTARTEEAAGIAALDDAAFLERLGTVFGGRAGRFLEAGPRALFPLQLKVADAAGAKRTLVLGNAAQTLHPVAGQGFNLGLRDAAELAAQVRACAPPELGSDAMLAAYRGRRGADKRATIAVTDTLVRLFSNDLAPLRAARGFGLAALDLLPPAKRFLARRMMFGVRG